MAPLQLLPGVSTVLQGLTLSTAKSSKPQLSQYSGHPASTISHWCLSFKAIVMSGLLCGTRLSVTIVLSHASFTWSFAIAAEACAHTISLHIQGHISYSIRSGPLNATLSCRLLYSFCAILEQPLTMCHKLSQLFPHDPHKGESLVLSM